MASMPTRDPLKDALLTPQNAAVLIIDYQPLQVSSVESMDKHDLVENITTVAKAAKLYGMPVVFTTVNVKSGKNAPMIHQLQDVFPDLEAFDRTSINAWEDADFYNAVKAIGRKKLVMGALWTEVCLAFPALDAMREGYDVFAVTDAVGGTSVDAHNAGLRRIEQAGAHPIGWVSLLCELQRDWNRAATVPQFADLVFTVEGN